MIISQFIWILSFLDEVIKTWHFLLDFLEDTIKFNDLLKFILKTFKVAHELVMIIWIDIIFDLIVSDKTWSLLLEIIDLWLELILAFIEVYYLFIFFDLFSLDFDELSHLLRIDVLVDCEIMDLYLFLDSFFQFMESNLIYCSVWADC